MSLDDRRWVEHWCAMHVERMRASKVTRETLRRSYEQLAKSEELLKNPLPKVWHPEPPE
jgi:hypothetical protein